MANSTRKNGKQKAGQAAKPYRDFPLTPQRGTNRWCKKHKGKQYYFGPLEDWQAALAKFKRDWPYITQGKEPPPPETGDSCTMRTLANAFLNSKRRKVEAGELAARSFDDYQRTAESLIEHFGKDRRVDDLQPADFEKYRAKLAKKWGVVTLRNEVNRCRVIFKYAYDNRLISAPVNFGQAFDRPSAKTLRKARNAAGPRLFEAVELRRILDALDGNDVIEDDDGEELPLKAEPHLKAMVLLGLNCGFGNTDVASLPQSAVDFKTGWADFPRSKTEIPRRIPLWPETLTALRDAIEDRPVPATRDEADLCFVTVRGNRWVRVAESKKRPGRLVQLDALSQRFSKLLNPRLLGRTPSGYPAIDVVSPIVNLLTFSKTMPDPVVNIAALEPLFGPSDVPNQHRVRAKKAGAPAEIVNGRRPSPLSIVQNLRQQNADWRDAQYAGASDTSRELLYHWFHTDHRINTLTGESYPFSYYFCQREANEALVYLHEVRGIRRQSSLTANFATDPDEDPLEAEVEALGISPQEDEWAKYAFKVATGAGKTQGVRHAVARDHRVAASHFNIEAPPPDSTPAPPGPVASGTQRATVSLSSL